MDSKEATSQPLPGASSGYHSSTYTSETESLLDKTIDNDDNDVNDSKGVVSEDEGYVSGEEVFETASDKPGLCEIVGEGDFDASTFVDASEKIEALTVKGVMVNDDDDKGNKYVDGDESLVEKDFEGGFAAGEGGEFGGIEGHEGKGETHGLVEEIGVTSGGGMVESGGEEVVGNVGNQAVKEVEVKGDESEETVKIQPRSSVDEAGVHVAEEVSDMKLLPEGDSVVDTIQVDLAAPGVAVVGEKETNGDVVNEPEEKEVAEVDVVELEMPGVAVVGEKETNGDVVNEPEEKEVAEVDVVEPEMSKAVGLNGLTLMSESDSVVDTIQVDKVGAGVVVVGETEENIGEKIEGVEVPLISFGGGTTGIGDDFGKEVSSREAEVVYQSSEPAADMGEFVNSKPLQLENDVVGDEKDEKLDAGAVVNVVNGVHKSITSNDSVDRGEILDVENGVRKSEVKNDLTSVSKAIENGTTGMIGTDGQVGHAGACETNGEPDGVPEESKWAASAHRNATLGEIDETHLEDSMSDGDTDGMIFGSSEAAKKFIEELGGESGGDSHALEQSDTIDGQIVTDSEEEGDTDDEGDGKELFDSAALAALLKAATGADSDGSSITITSQDGSRLFSVERPAGLGSSLQSLRAVPRPNRANLFEPTPAAGVETEDNLSEEEKKKLEKLQQIRVKFLRLVHRLGLSVEESVASQVLYRLAVLGGRQGIQTFSLDAAKTTALQLEAGEKDDLDFSVNILVLGKSGVGKSATINSVFGEEKVPIDAFETRAASAKEVSGFVNGVKVRVIDTPGLKSSVMEQGLNRGVLSSVKKFTRKSPPDVVLYVDRLDAQTRDLNDVPLLKTVTSALNPSIWRSAVVTLTHAASAPPDGPSGTPLSYEVFVSQRSHVLQQSIGHAVGDLRMMSPSLMNPVSLVENHPSCRKNREGQKILPNGQSWRPQLLLLCYSMKILSEASSLAKPQDPLDHRKLFGFRARAPPLPYMLSSMLQSRPHPKLPSDENADSDVDLDDFSDSEQEEEDEYDQLPPFKPLKKAQMARLTKEQKKAYFEEYDYRVKLLQKKQWKEELRRMREIKKRGKDATTDYGFAEDDPDSGAAAPVAVPLPDMALPPSFDGDNPAYRYRFLEPTSQFLARPVLDSHGWDHDCGYDGVNVEHSLAIVDRFPLSYTVQITKDKKDFTISLDSSVSAKHGDSASTMAGFDIQSIGKQLAYIVRGEGKFKNLKKNKASGGISLTFLGENVVPGLKIEDQVTIGKQYVLVGSAGAVRSHHDTAYGANFELQRRELDYPVGQVQSTLSMSIIKWRGDLALGFNTLAQFSIGRNSKVAVRAGINNKLSGQLTVRTSSSEHLSLALAAIVPAALSIYKKLFSGASGEKYSIY